MHPRRINVVVTSRRHDTHKNGVSLFLICLLNEKIGN